MPRQPNDFLPIRAADAPHLREVCESFLYATRWAGWLGEPMPRNQTTPKDKRYVRQLRHTRGWCLAMTGRHDL